MFFTNFEKLCQSKGKSTTAVGKELGISKTTISYWRNTKGTTPKQEVLIRIAEYFNVSTDFLLGINEKRPLGNNAEEPKDDRLNILYELTKELNDNEILALKSFVAGLKANRKPD